ncbi:Integrator complex subunit 9-like, partial [Paramuricea clavata]
FEEANSVYEAQYVYLKKRGLAKTEHKPPIADEDFKKLYESGVFNTDSPATLQNKVFFEIMFFFCRRERRTNSRKTIVYTTLKPRKGE